LDKIKPDHIELMQIPRPILDGTWRYLRDRGRRKLEGVVYWTGEASPEAGVVRHFLTPSRYATESAVHLTVGREAVFELLGQIHALDEFLLARVHSHPEEAFHSWSDDEGCVSGRVGFLSIVVPNFARDPPLADCWAVYERTDRGRWRRLDRIEIFRRFELS